MGTNPSSFNSGEIGDHASRHPVERVSLEAGTEFCRKITDQEQSAGRLSDGWEYTLPTEAQWEYACRAGTTTATAFGDSLGSQQANFDGNYPYNNATVGPFKEQTTPVGSHEPNAWNLCDMHGNVYEWCQDWFVDKLPGGTDPAVLEQGEASLRVGRGGSWDDLGQYCRSADRSGFVPGSRGNDLGFRVAVSSTR